MNKQDIGKKALETRISWPLSYCYNHYTTESTVLVENFKLHLLHAVLFFFLPICLIHLITWKSLFWKKTKISFKLLNSKCKIHKFLITFTPFTPVIGVDVSGWHLTLKKRRKRFTRICKWIYISRILNVGVRREFNGIIIDFFVQD